MIFIFISIALALLLIIRSIGRTDKSHKVSIPKADNSEWHKLSAKMDLRHLESMAKYELECAELEAQRKAFYEKNPDFPNKCMFMQVCAPPMKFSIKLID